MVDVILKIKTSLPETAAECLAIFGEGGYQLGEGETIEDVQVENWIGHVNTPLLQGYTRVRIGEYFGQALEFIDANGGSVNADLIRVEWPLETTHIEAVDFYDKVERIVETPWEYTDEFTGEVFSGVNETIVYDKVYSHTADMEVLDTYPPFEVEVDASDIDGNITGKRMQEIGSF